MRPRHLALSELLALFVLLAIGAAIRYRLLGVTMTHVDDYGPLTQVLGAVKEGWSGWRIMGSIRDWTYAPGQFLITGLLLPLGRTFEDYVHLGRLVSWGFAVAGLLLLARACSRLSGPADFSLRAPVLLPVAIAALSLRGLIESSQAYNYAATLPVGVLLTLAFSSDRPVAILEGRHGAWRALLMGVLLGHSFWITYQAIFLVVAGFGALALERFARQPRQAWRELRGFLPAGFGVLLPLYHVYRFHLHLVKDRGLPGWEARLPTATLTDKIVFLAQGLRDVFVNCTTPVPWGATALLVGTTVLALTFAGGWLAWRGSGGARASSQVGRLVTFTLCALGVFALGGLAGKFPFGPTRHTYVLQGPILLAFSAALSALAPAAPRRLQAWLAPLGTLALAGLFAAGYPGFEDSIRNHFDMEAIRALARSAPGRVVIMNLPRSYTWEHHLLEDSFREPRFSMRSGEALWAASLKERPDAMVLFSHRAPLTETSRHELQQAGCTVRTVREIPPVGSTELMGNINGGNGYFLYEARCAAH